MARRSRPAPAAPKSWVQRAEPALVAALDPEVLPLLDAIARLGAERQEPVYLVGGAVRDALLRRPTGDLDVCVVGDGPGFGAALAAGLGAKVRARSQFGTIGLQMAGQRRIDVVTARSEHYPKPGSLPVVRPGTLAEDLMRRDFSVNAMALGLWGPDVGRVADPCGGWADLGARQLRVLHAQSFRDDPTRILRAARYGARLAFSIAEQTNEWLLEAVPQLPAVGGARLGRELVRLLEERAAGDAWDRCRAWGAVDTAFPGLQWDPAVASEDLSAQARLAVMAVGLVPLERIALVRRLQLPPTFLRCMAGFNAVEQCLVPLRHAAPSCTWRLLHEMDGAAITAWWSLGGRGAKPQLAAYRDVLSKVRPRLKGDEVARLSGLEGPELGTCIEALRDAVLDGAAVGRAAERAFVRSYAPGRRRKR